MKQGNVCTRCGGELDTCEIAGMALPQPVCNSCQQINYGCPKKVYKKAVYLIDEWKYEVVNNDLQRLQKISRLVETIMIVTDQTILSNKTLSEWCGADLTSCPTCGQQVNVACEATMNHKLDRIRRREINEKRRAEK